jgi:transposase
VHRAVRAGLSWPLPAELDDEALEARLFAAASGGVDPRVEPDWSHVHQELKRPGVTRHLLWLEYVAAHPGGYRYSQFCEHYRRFVKTLAPTMRQRHVPGEKVFTDFSGKRPHLVDRRTGELTAVELFVAVLGASGLIFAEATPRQDLRSWILAHIHMVEYFGGSAAVWVPDQLKSAITVPCRYEPQINRSFRDLATHYGAVVIPARPGKPRDKAKVENAVLVAQRWILARLRDVVFFSLGELNGAIRTELDQLNDRPVKHLGASRRVLFERLDRPVLLTLPAGRYQIGHWKDCRVNIDYHVEIEHHYYSVPYQLVGEMLEARYTDTTVEIYRHDRRITSHRRLYGHEGASTKPEHMPSSHRAHAQWTPSRLIGWAEKTGPATGRVVAEILRRRRHPEQGYRSCLGLMRLGRQYGPERLEAACARAEHLRVYSYRTVKNMLSAGVEHLAPESESDSTTPVHANIRGATYYCNPPQEDPPC